MNYTEKMVRQKELLANELWECLEAVEPSPYEATAAVSFLLCMSMVKSLAELEYDYILREVVRLTIEHAEGCFNMESENDN